MLLHNDGKNLALFHECIFPHNPRYKKPKIPGMTPKMIQQWCLEEPNDIDTCNALENTMPYLSNGAYTKVHSRDGHGKDFSDGSDLKTWSMHPNPDKNRRTGKNTNSYGGELQLSRAGQLKKGALRIVMWISCIGRLRYYYVPREEWLAHIRTRAKFVYIGTTYNSKKDRTTWLEEFRVKDFKDLCAMTDAKWMARKLLAVAA